MLLISEMFYFIKIKKAYFLMALISKVVAPGRIELPTQGFSVLCSTD
jgi:hypothetical protein